MATQTSRRNFLRSAPLAAAASLALPEMLEAQAAPEPMAAKYEYKLLSGGELAKQEAALHAKPGNFDFTAAAGLPLTCVLTVEEHKTGAQFEWHEHRDHMFQILEGETSYELGGKPEGAHMTKPGEWLALQSVGATTVPVRKGDILIVPRNVPHKRSTAGSVTFLLISANGEPQA
jgi:mannose-6-phosphate isomerase-like protein (cupin superfamily)